MHVPKDDCDLRIRAPFRLHPEGNARGHWAKTYRRRRKQRDDLRLFLNVSRKPKLPVDVFLTRIAPRKMDEHDGLPMAFKALVDEICDWLGIDDGGSEIKFHYDQMKGKPREHKVQIEFYGS